MTPLDAAPFAGDERARSRLARHRLLYGDWSWLVRDGLDLLRLAFVAGTVAFAIQGRSTAVGLTAACAVLLIGRIVDLPRWFDFGLIVAMTAIAWGTALTLYGRWFYYDKVVHGVSPIGYAPVLYIVLVRLGVVPDPGQAIRERRLARIGGIFIITLAAGIAVGAGYENVEWISDRLLGTHLARTLFDVETDLLADTAGSLAGATFLTVWALRGWTSRRRTAVPAPTPALTPFESVGRRLRAAGSGAVADVWRRRLAGLPLAMSGLISLAVGTSILVWRSPALRTVEVLFGIAMLTQSVLDVPGAVRGPHGLRRPNGALVALGEAALGAAVILSPGITRLGLAYLIGSASVVLALLQAAVLSSACGSERSRWLAGTGSVVALVFGVAILALPDHSLDATVVALGLFLMSLGALRVVRAIDARLLRPSPLEGHEGEVDDEGKVVGAAARAEAVTGDGDPVANQAVVERDAQERAPCRPAVDRP
jgi:uncharacterized membrane protein HdeD (DUF308 family)